MRNFGKFIAHQVGYHSLFFFFFNILHIWGEKHVVTTIILRTGCLVYLEILISLYLLILYGMYVLCML